MSDTVIPPSRSLLLYLVIIGSRTLGQESTSMISLYSGSAHYYHVQSQHVPAVGGRFCAKNNIFFMFTCGVHILWPLLVLSWVDM